MATELDRRKCDRFRAGGRGPVAGRFETGFLDETLQLAELDSAAFAANKWHTIRDYIGWQSQWGDVNSVVENNHVFLSLAAGSTIEGFHIVGLDLAGQIWHTVRSDARDGLPARWQPVWDSVDANMVNRPGPFRSICAAGVGGDLHIFAVAESPYTSNDGDLSTTGQLWHAVRRAVSDRQRWSSRWECLDAQVGGIEGGPFTEIAAAATGSELHVVGLTPSGRVRHAVFTDYGNKGSVWQRHWTDLTTAVGGEQGPFASVSVGGTGRPVDFQAPITSDGLAALGGSVHVTIYPSGEVAWEGHAHDSGADGYHFAVSGIVRAPGGAPPIVFTHSGYVGGTFTAGSPDNNWKLFPPLNQIVAAHFSDYLNAEFELSVNYSSAIGSALTDVLEFTVGILGAPLLLPIGALVFVGAEVASLISTGSLVPGARFVGGVLELLGPSNILFVLAAEGIANLGSRTRVMAADEYAWANQQVFDGSLPDRQTLIITDTIGVDGRAFTLPRFDGKITINLGSGGFTDPIAARPEILITSLSTPARSLTPRWIWHCSGMDSRSSDALSRVETPTCIHLPGSTTRA